MTSVEQALREALEWAIDNLKQPDEVAWEEILPPPGLVFADCGTELKDGKAHVIRRLTINYAHLDSLRGKL